jgi:hypothetical protein
MTLSLLYNLSISNGVFLNFLKNQLFFRYIKLEKKNAIIIDICH